jgi:hypothetical protein
VEDQALPRWSIGAGIGLGGWSLGYGQLGCLASSSGGLSSSGSSVGLGCGWSPQGSVLVEFQLSRRSALVFDGTFSYMKPVSSNLTDTSAKGGGLSLGWRQLLNPGGVIEISVVGVLAGDWHALDSGYQIINNEDDSTIVHRFHQYSYDVGVRVGLVLERKLIDNLYLRLESSIGQMSYFWSESRYTSLDTQKVSRSGAGGLSVSLAISPAIQLRMTF